MVSPDPQRVLFVDPSHGSRSHMAAALLRAAGGDRFAVSSAGIEPTGALDQVDEVLWEVGIGNFTAEYHPISAVLDQPPDLLIVVCEEGCGHCPFVPGAGSVLRWPQPDPDVTAPPGRMAVLRQIRGDLELRVAQLVDMPRAAASGADAP